MSPTERFQRVALAVLVLGVVAARAGEPADQKVGDAWHDSRNPIVQIFAGKRLDLWSLQALQQPDPPAVKQEQWVRNPIDQFILARLEPTGHTPAPSAVRRVLARRLYFDLAGLPPKHAELERFQADDRPDAYERLVDELLSSPRYGEQMARMWLDVVRYSDSNGFDWDEFRPKAWLFRDYVIRSFNADKPFDQFIREQLAGDELLETTPRSPAEQDALIATGFLRVGPQDNSAPLFNEQRRARAEWLADLTETTGSAFLGLTFACCRCHDHKHDPLSHADHYRLRAFFEPIKVADDLAMNLPAEREAIQRHNSELEADIKPVKHARDELRALVAERVRQTKIEKLPDEDQTLWKNSTREESGEIKTKLAKIKKAIEPTNDELKAARSKDEQAEDQKLEARIAELEKKRRPFSFGLFATDGTDKVAVSHILANGDYKSPGEAVVPGFISVLDPNPAKATSPPNSKATGRRLALANWIASADNPLTARVLVNRVWQLHFGRGLVGTANDFGLAGDRPTHPELLDWLASEFIRRKWSIKELQRLIVTSATYRQAVAMPAAGERDVAKVRDVLSLFGPPAPRRLTAEQLRDAVLAVAGLLTNKSDGPPIWPELPAEILQANPAFLDDNPMKTKGWYPSPPDQQAARSIFLVQKRNTRVAFLETFDKPENMVSCGSRNQSTVAPQALSLLNSPFMVQAAKSFAERVQIAAGNGHRDQVDRIFQEAFQRLPTEDERAASLDLLKSRNLTELCRVIFNLNEFIYVD